MEQITDTVLMIAPTHFGFNEEAFLTNSFQNKSALDPETIQESASNEFHSFVEKLRELDVEVIVYRDTENSVTPDSIFPNNWFSTHIDGKMILYPMAVSNRRDERRKDIIEDLRLKYYYSISDLTSFEDQGHFLEGTGSLLLDHKNRIAYAAVSPRTDEKVLEEFSKITGYSPLAFKALGKSGELIYHTNVMLCIAENYAVIGLDTIIPEDRERVKKALLDSGKEIIALTKDQVYHSFAGNMLQIKNKKNETILVMSKKAHDQLAPAQLERFDRLNDHILEIEIPIIEEIGGGSVRCMLAEIFKPN